MAKQATKAAVRAPARKRLQADVTGYDHATDTGSVADHSEAKMTQGDAIAQAFNTLRAAGLLPVTMEAVPEANVDRALVQASHLGQQKPGIPSPLYSADPVGSFGGTSPGTVSVKQQMEPPKVQRAMLTQNTQLMTASMLNDLNEEISALTKVLQPYLPQWLFSDEDGNANDEQDNNSYLPTGGSDMSPVLAEANRAYNDLVDLKRRLVRLNRWVVL